MPDLNDLYSLISEISKKNSDNPTGIISVNRTGGSYDTRMHDRYVSTDSSERWFLMGISVWGADSEGNADVVGE